MSASAPVSTLEEIKSRLQARRERDVTRLPTHHHEALGTVHIAFMPTAGYRDIEAATVSPGGNYESWSVDEKLRYHGERSDRAYLKWGVVTADNQRLDEEIIQSLLNGDYGAENRKLINAIRKQNPPREELVLEFEGMFAFSGMTCVLIRILARAGMLQKIRDYLLAESHSEEAKVLSEDLRKWEETLPVWEAFFDAEEKAKVAEIDVYQNNQNTEPQIS